MTITKLAIAYHHPCTDGTCAAWVAKRNALKTWPELEKIRTLPVTYGKPLPNFAADEHVLFVDFCPENPKELEQSVAKLTVLDHHISRKNEVESLENGHFDVTKSGALLTANFFQETDPLALTLARYVSDRDLWTFKEAHSKIINNVLQCIRHDPEEWESLFQRYRHHDPEGFLEEAYSVGLGVDVLKNWQLEQFDNAALMMTVGEHTVKSFNVPYFLASDLLNRHVEDQPFVISWFLGPTGIYHYSLRSNKETGLSVAEIAESFGGGGHKNAAGFELDYLLPIHT